MNTSELLCDINRLPISQQMLIAEHIMRSIRQEKQSSMKKAVEFLYTDYLFDKDLTVFTQLDCENFYETRWNCQSYRSL